MARGGKRGNPYRDANGRFASASTGRAGLGASRAKSSPAAARKAAKSQSSRTSTLAARSSLKRSRAKLAGRDPADQRLSSALSSRAQKGAVTRGSKALSAAKAAARTRLQGSPAASTISKSRSRVAVATARSVTPRLAGRKVKSGMNAARTASSQAKSIDPAKAVTSELATKNNKKLAKGPRASFPRVATPTGAIRKSDLAKIKADAQKGIGTPFSRASQRAVARSAREAPLIRKRAIADAKRKGKTGFERGPKMNTGAIANNRDFGWNRKGEPATTQERLDMWRKSERRIRGFWSGGRGVAGAYAGDLRASRRAAQLIESGNRLGDLPTTRKLAEQPRQRRLSRLEANRTKANLELSNADRAIKPKIDKLQTKIQERRTAGKKATEAQVNNLRELVNQYNKSVRRRQVADAAQSFYQSPWTYKPKKFSGKNIDRQLSSFL